MISNGMNYKKGFIHQNFLKKISGGFTLLELLVVVAIIGLLTTVVVAALTNARNKGGDAGAKANLRNAISQGEIFYGTNTASPNSYTGVCTNGTVGGAKAVGIQVSAAAKANGYSSYAIDAVGSSTTVTCNDTANGWAAEVPLKEVSGNMWCVDWTGKSVLTAGSTLTTTTDVLCN